MYALSFYPHEELQNKSKSALHEMIHKAGHNWSKLEDKYKNGVFIARIDNNWTVFDKCPNFKTDRNFVETYLYNVEGN